MPGLSNNLSDLVSAAPELVDHPQVPTALAQGGATPDEAQAVQMGIWAVETQKRLGTFTGSDKSAYWSTLSPAQQTILKQIGVEDPTQKRGWFSTAVNGIESAAGVVGDEIALNWQKSGAESVWDSGVGDVLTAPAKDLKNMAGNAMDLAMEGQHRVGAAANAALFEAENYGGGGDGREVFSSFLTGLYSGGADGFKRAYRDAYDHKAVYVNSTLKQIQDKYDPTTFALAKAVDMGANPNDLLAALDPNTQQSVNAIMNSDTFSHALTELHAAQVSYGRVVAHDLGLDPNSPKFTFVSGPIDAVQTVLTDPTLLLGRMNEAYKGARYGAGVAEGFFEHGLAGGATAAATRAAKSGVKVTSDDPALYRARINQLMGDPANGVKGDKNVRRYYGSLLEHVNAATKPAVSEAAQKAKQNAMNNVQRVFTGTAPFNNELIERAAHIQRTEGRAMTLDDVREHMLELGGMARILTGNPYDHVPMLAHDNLLQGKIRDARSKLDIVGALQRPMEDAKATNLLAGGSVSLGAVGDGPDLRQFSTRPQAALPDGTLAQQAGRAFGESRKGLDGMQQRVATALTRANTRVVMARKLDLSNPQSISQVHDLARTFAPKFYAGKITAAYAEADTAGRRQIVKGLISTLMESSGVMKSEAGARWARQFLSDYDNTAFSASGASQLHGVETGIGFADTRPHVPLPDFKTMYRMSQHEGATAFALKSPLLQSTVTDRIMSSAWRPGVLLRPALAVRNALEEQVNFALRNGIGDYLEGRGLARDFLGSEEFGSVVHTIARTAGLPTLVGGKRTYNKATKLADDVYGLFTDHVVNQMRKRGLDVSDPDIKLIREVFQKDPVHRALYLDEIKDQASTLASDGRGVLIERTKRRGGNVVPMRSIPSGEWKKFSLDDANAAQRWAARADYLAKDGLYSVGLANIRDRNAAIQAMKDVIDAPTNEWYRKSNVLYKTVGSQGVAQRAYEELAHTFSDKSGNLLTSLLDEVAPAGKGINRDKITTDTFENVHPDDRPTSVVGQEMIHMSDEAGLIQDFINRGFDVLDDATAYLSRQPIYFHHLKESAKQMLPLRQALIDAMGGSKQALENADRLWLTAAHNAAKDNTMAFVDNPLNRSQLSVVVRNLFPFWRAQEEFYRRWANTFLRHPVEGAARIDKLGQALHAMHASGFTFKDDNGNESFAYPGTTLAVRTVGRLAAVFPGLNSSVPIMPLEFTGQLKMLNQGADLSSMRPSAGPILAIPLAGWKMLFPSDTANQAANLLLGSENANRPLTDALIPTPVRRFYQALTDSQQVANAQMAAMQYMHAHGLDPSDTAGKGEKDQYLDRANHWAKEILALKAILGLVGPASPQGGGDFSDKTNSAQRAFGNRTLSSEFKALLDREPYEVAIGQYMAMNPDGSFLDGPLDANGNPTKGTMYGPSAYTVAKTQAPSKATVLATDAVGKFTRDNKNLIATNKNASAYWLPLDAGDFDQQTYTDELAKGLRLRKDTKDFYMDLKIAGAMKLYYATKDLSDNAIKQMGGTGSYGAKQQEQNWSSWRKQFLAVHPDLAEELAGYGARAYDRTQTWSDIKKVVSSSQAPAGPVTDQFRQMIAATDRYEATKATFTGQTDYQVRQRKALTAGFQQELSAIAGQSENAKMLYDRILRPMYNLDADDGS